MQLGQRQIPSRSRTAVRSLAGISYLVVPASSQDPGQRVGDQPGPAGIRGPGQLQGQGVGDRGAVQIGAFGFDAHQHVGGDDHLDVDVPGGVLVQPADQRVGAQLLEAAGIALLVGVARIRFWRSRPGLG
ncbi:MAG: hypothetical protein V9G10_07415 [Candidatus Nanopelagicales bacterium]